MGDAAYMARDLENLINAKIESQNIKEGYWTTKDGREIHLKNMTIPHLENTIRMLKITFNPENMFFNFTWIGAMTRELKSRKIQEKLDE